MITYLVGRLTQAKRIRLALLECLESGITDKQNIYTLVAEKTQSPRPTVRKCVRDLRLEFETYLKVLTYTETKKKQDGGKEN